MTSEVAHYTLDDGTAVAFEIAPASGYRPAGAADTLSRVREAVTPAVEAARVVAEQVRAAAPDEVEVKFGVKVSGEANWWIAKAATEATFEVTLTWKAETAQP
jgi:predicted neutral ceramidase superfamily lipid hydrolase